VFLDPGGTSTIAYCIQKYNDIINMRFGIGNKANPDGALTGGIGNKYNDQYY